jgi:putative ABC transport system substrate-binding protein
MAANFKTATGSIPIVAAASDPVAAGLVPSLAHPGGNLTGVAPDGGIEFYAKHLQLLRELIPTASRIAYLTPRAVWESVTLLAPVKEAAKQLGVSLIPASPEAPMQEREYRRVFKTMTQDHVEALIVGDSSENYSQSKLIIDLAERARLPALYPDRSFADRGGLMSFGVFSPDLWRRAGHDIAEILKGANPGDIPFYQATRFELVINLNTAKALGLTVPQSILQRADEVIE